MKTIVDAGPLMKFGRIGRIDLLQSLYGPVELVPAVDAEIKRGLAHDPPKPDAVAVCQAISAGLISVTGPIEENVASALARGGRPGHDGESKSIDLLDALDQQGEETRFITDDRGAADEALRYTWHVTSSLHAVHAARDRGLLTTPWSMLLRDMGAERQRFEGNILSDFRRRFGYDPFDEP